MKEKEAKGFVETMVASWPATSSGRRYLYQKGIPSYVYSTALLVEVLGAKYKWARGAGAALSSL